jgi:hypothetical protein
VRERNNCQVLSEQTSDPSALLNSKCFLKFVLNCEQHFSLFDPDYPISALTVTGLARVYCIFVVTAPHGVVEVIHLVAAWTGNYSFDSRQGEREFRPVLGSTRPPMRWVPADIAPEIKRPGRESGYSPPPSDEVKDTFVYVPIFMT